MIFQERRVMVLRQVVIFAFITEKKISLYSSQFEGLGRGTALKKRITIKKKLLIVP